MRDVSANEDVIGRDKNVNNHYSQRKTQIDGWIEKLAEERKSNSSFREFVDNLQYYLNKHEHDYIVGLEAKLDFAGRKKQYKKALKKKEAFAKLLEEWRSYPSAQEIIAYFLARIDGCFETHIEPALGNATRKEIESLIEKHLVEPILSEMGTGPFMLSSLHVNGMVYWLAEQCYIRWHQ